MESQSAPQNVSPEQAIHLILAQIAVTIVLAAALFLFVQGDDAHTAAVSAVVGGAIATIANAWFSWKVFGLKSMDDPAKVLRSLYIGEINKLLLTGALFVIAFVMIEPVNGAALIAVYFVAHMTPFVGSMFVNNTH